LTSKRLEDAAEKAKKRVAREYRSKGYEIADLAKGGASLEFLRDFDPDLVAIKGEDRVVVEIKEARALRGSNEITELARRVKNEGWRLEVIALASEDGILSHPTGQRLRALSERSRSAFARELPDVAFVYSVSLLEELLRDLATQNGIDALQHSPMLIARELAFQGLLSENAVQTLQEAWAWRNSFVHGPRGASVPTSTDLDTLIELCGSIQSTLKLQAAE
jgi:hypothetical protein